MKTEQEVKKVKEIILKLLASDNRCRNDDKWLTYRVMRTFTNIYIPYEDFDKIPSFETIKRTRAYIQNVDKQFIPTDPNVIAKRENRRKEFRELFRSK
jgi:hypothetical protein